MHVFNFPWLITTIYYSLLKIGWSIWLLALGGKVSVWVLVLDLLFLLPTLLLFFSFLFSFLSSCFFFFPSSSPSVLNHSQGLSWFLNSHCLTSESLGFLLASLNFLWSQNCCLLSYYEIFYLIIASVDLNHSLHPPVMKRRRRTVIDIFMELLAYNKP